jgi:hypothetical protein
MTTTELEWRAVHLVEPSFGALAEPVRMIKPQSDPDYPGHTFDFVARRADGTTLAIEVTGAWDADWLRAQNTMQRLASRLTPELAVAGCAPGHYGLQSIDVRDVPSSLGHIRLDELARAASTLAPHTDVQTEYGFEIRHWGGSGDRPVAFGSVTTAEFMEGGESKERFKRAVAGCTPKLDSAGNDGMRTHLIVVHWMLGSTNSFKLALDEIELGTHPQEIWVVDLGGWPNREPTERLR